VRARRRDAPRPGVFHWSARERRMIRNGQAAGRTRLSTSTKKSLMNRAARRASVKRNRDSF
jgi:hypothetical protein